MMLTKFSKFIAGRPKFVVLIASLLLIPSVICYLLTGVNYDILTYLPQSLESTQGTEILDTTFNDAAMAIVMVEGEDAQYVAGLKNEIANVDGVETAMWVDDIADTSIPQSMLPDILNSVFYTKDGSGTMMLVKFTDSGSSEQTMNALRQIRKLMNKNCFMSGLSTITLDTKDLCDSEAPIYIAIAVVLALIAMAITTDSWLLPPLMLVSIGYAIIYNMGTNLIFGEISYITQSIAAILQLGVTMDFSVFLIDRYNEEKPKHPDRTSAMAAAIEGTFTSVSGSSLTTVFGFLALCFMEFTLGLDIGLVMAKGVLLGLFTVVTFLPALVLLFEKQIVKLSHKARVPSFAGLNRFTIKHKKVFAIIFLLLFIPAWFGQNSVQVYYNMVDSIPDTLESVVGLNKLKNDFDMATTHFVIFDEDLPASSINKMTDEIRDVEGVELCMSVSSIVGGAIPLSILPEDIKSICVSGGYQLMMINSAYSSATDELNAQVDSIKEIVKKYDSSAYLTGEGVLTKDLIEVTDKDFKVTGIVSVAAIFILILIIFRSASVPFILVGAIELAIMINESFAFILQSDVPFIAPTVIGCVQLGATVDYAMLMTTRFREELRKGRSKEEAIMITANESDGSIFRSAVVFFVATFGVYLTCDISIIKSICALLARGAIISGIVIIVFLPPVLSVFEGLINKTSYSWRKESPLKRKNKKNTADVIDTEGETVDTDTTDGETEEIGNTENNDGVIAEEEVTV